MALKYVKKIKGTANKNGLKNAVCKQGFMRFSRYLNSLVVFSHVEIRSSLLSELVNTLVL